MMRCKNGVLLVSLAALACSGKYEVGEMDPAGGGSNSSGTSAGGQGTAGGAGTGNNNAGGAAPTSCFTAIAPTPLNAPFVEPEVVWQRIRPFVYGPALPGQEPPPPELPSDTTYTWAGQVVDESFALSIAETGSVPGGEFFVRQWLGLGSSSEALEGDYAGALAPDDTLLLEALLESDWGQGRVGAFSEPAWLAMKPSIPQRGLQISRLVFGVEIPPPPGNIDFTVDPSLPDRAAIEAKIDQPACMGCHTLFTPLGFALGHFDRFGDYRDLDHNLPIDTSGKVPFSSGGMLEFDGIADLGAKAVSTCQANLAIVDRFLEIALTLRGYEANTRLVAIEANRDHVQRLFVARGRTYHALVTAYAQSALVLR